MALNLNNHGAINVYDTTLAQLCAQGVTNEPGVRRAPGALLDAVGRPVAGCSSRSSA